MLSSSLPRRAFASSALPDEGSAPAHREGVSWGYWGAGAPNNWGCLSPDFGACDEGAAQSPINITGYTEDRDAPQLSFKYGGNARAVYHNGMIAHVEYDAGNSIAIGDRVYGLEAMHIHVHAEHQIDAQLFPAEMHLGSPERKRLLRRSGPTLPIRRTRPGGAIPD